MRATIGGWVLMAAVATVGSAQEAPRFRLDGEVMYQTRVTEARPDGQLAVEITQPGGQMTEGYYLGLASAKPLRRRLPAGATLARVQVIEVTERGASLQVGKEAAAIIKPGSTLVIFRPRGSTTAQIQAAPDAASIVDRKAELIGLTRGSFKELTESQTNLKMIGLALHNFHDVYNFFPPAVIHGPDGKPWHSWRALILPFVEQRPLFEAYRFDEPWDGPNNSKLLEKIPSVYRDPVHGEPMDYYTHYALATGKGVAFPAQGIGFDGTPANIYTSDKKGNVGRLQFRAFRDGVSNSILCGSVSPGRKIPWMKPEDVLVGDDFPAPGKADAKGKESGFAAPYASGRGAAGVFLFADASVQTITDAVPPDAFRTLLTIADGIPVDRASVPTLDPTAPGGRRTTPVLTIEKTSKGVVAKIDHEPSERESLEEVEEIAVPVDEAPKPN